MLNIIGLIVPKVKRLLLLPRVWLRYIKSDGPVYSYPATSNKCSAGKRPPLSRHDFAIH
jgi:hypothetical protein